MSDIDRMKEAASEMRRSADVIQAVADSMDPRERPLAAIEGNREIARLLDDGAAEITRLRAEVALYRANIPADAPELLDQVLAELERLRARVAELEKNDG